MIYYGIHPFDICLQNPDLWSFIKYLFIFCYLFSSIFISYFFYTYLLSPIFQKILSFFQSFYTHFNHKISILSNSNLPLFYSPSPFYLFIGKSISTNSSIILNEKSLFQNILITGSIGSGKTSSAMYPFTKQLIQYSSCPIPMLILDVKGNYHVQVKKWAKEFHREDDLIILELGGKFNYNPLDKPHLKPSILANRLKTILLLFSPQQTESYWLDQAEKTLTEFIKFCRLYHDNYVNFEELHKLITFPNYYKEKISILRKKFIHSDFSYSQIYDLYSSLNYIEKEFFSLDVRTLSILKSEITRITHYFVSDYDVMSTFSPSKENINFFGFSEAISSGKIVVLNMNISEYKNLAKILATYLKLDFQSEVLMRLSHSSILTPVAFICDEYSEYCTASDSDFFSQSREAKCINIVSTQSYTSLLNAIGNSHCVEVIIHNLVNKLWFRTDDIYTIENIQKQLGKEDKEKISSSISENARETNFSYFTHSLNSSHSNISESINTYFQFDYIYDTNFFTRNLETFCCLSFLSDGEKILDPQKLKLIPFFKE